MQHRENTTADANKTRSPFIGEHSSSRRRVEFIPDNNEVLFIERKKIYRNIGKSSRPIDHRLLISDIVMPFIKCCY